MVRYQSVVEAVGGTPLIRLNRVTTGLRPQIYVKAEWQNPGGSVKDRTALAMIRRAEADGSLRPGGTVVETTSGNTGIGLALFAAYLGYRSVVFSSSSISAEKRAQFTAYGAQVRYVDNFVPKTHPDSLFSLAQRFVAETPGAWFAGQYDNPANPEAHLTSTGPEIWADTEGAVTHLVATVGTGGTISGTGSYLKQVSEGRVQVIGADPLTSSYSGGDGSQKYIEGAGHFVHPLAEQDLWPQSLHLDVIDRYLGIDDRRAIDTIRELARTEGILAGGSSGVALAAAYEVARDLTEDDTVVVVLPDSGRAYLSTYFNDGWLRAAGFRQAEHGPYAGEVALAVPSVTWGTSAGRVLEAVSPERLSEETPVLVVHHRAGRVMAPHPVEVAGVITLAALREASPRALVQNLAWPVPVRVGAGQGAGEALARLEVEAEERALVLTDGRVSAVVTRRALAEAVAATLTGGSRGTSR